MRFKYIILLFITFLVGCGEYNQEKENRLALENANKIIDTSKKLFSQGRFEEAILNTTEAIHVLQAAPIVPHKKLYFWHRNQANMAERIGRFELAVQFIDSALVHLSKTKYEQFDNYTLEKFSSQKFKATYLRKNFKFQESIDLTIELLQQKPFTEHHHQLKNNIALAYYDLGNTEQAVYYFTDLIKNNSLAAVDKMFYLRNRGKSYQQANNYKAAQTDFENALALMPLESDYSLYRFQTEKMAGELYLAMGEYNRAQFHFDNALDHHQTINQDPALYSIFDLKSRAATGLGDITNANAYQSKFDSLNRLHEMNQHAIDTKLHTYMLNVKKEQFDAAVYNAKKTRQGLLLWGVVALIAGALICASYKLVRLYKRRKLMMAQTQDIAAKYNI